MTKADLVDLIYERVGSRTRKQAKWSKRSSRSIRESLRDGSKVKISGFGTLIVKSQARAPPTRSPDRRPYHHLFPPGAILQAEPDPQGSRQQRLAREVTANEIRLHQQPEQSGLLRAQWQVPGGMSLPPDQWVPPGQSPGLRAEATGLAPHPFARMTAVDLMKDLRDSDTRLLNVIWAAHAFGFLVSRTYANE